MKKFKKVRLKRKTNQENKQTNNIKKKDTLPIQPVFLKDVSQVVYLFLFLKSIKQAQAIYVMEQCFLLYVISL